MFFWSESEIKNKKKDVELRIGIIHCNDLSNLTCNLFNLSISTVLHGLTYKFGKSNTKRCVCKTLIPL